MALCSDFLPGQLPARERILHPVDQKRTGSTCPHMENCTPWTGSLPAPRPTKSTALGDTELSGGSGRDLAKDTRVLDQDVPGGPGDS